jgi:hypothetical protein
MMISEPATLVTDYLLALFTGVLGRRLEYAARNSEWSGFSQTALAQRWWAFAFMATAVAGAAGGTVHGFQRAMARSLTNLLWLVTLESLVAAAFAVVSAAIVLVPWGRTTRIAATSVAAVAFGGYGLWVIRNPVFLAAIAAYGAALAVLVGVRLSVRPFSGGGWLLFAGVTLSVVAAGVQQSGWAIHRYFNHNDLYHVIQAVAVWLLYRAARASDELSGSSPES